MKHCNFVFYHVKEQIGTSQLGISSGASVDVEQYSLSANLAEQREGFNMGLLDSEDRCIWGFADFSLRCSFGLNVSPFAFLLPSIESSRPLKLPKPRRLN